jgi:hypothetical protein
MKTSPILFCAAFSAAALALCISCQSQSSPAAPASVAVTTTPVTPPTPSPTAFLPEELRKNLVLYFDFEQPTLDDRVPDQSGAGNDGKAWGARQTRDGIRGSGMEFGPRESYVSVPQSETLALRNLAKFTLMAWVKTSKETDAVRVIFEKSPRFALKVVGFTPRPLFNVGDSGTKPAAPTTSGQLVLNVFTSINYPFIGMRDYDTSAYSKDGSEVDHVFDGWHHVAATFQTAASSQLYFDGKLVTGATPRSEKPGERNLRGDLTIGGTRPQTALPSASTNGFNGTMDEVMIFNRALAEAEVKDLMRLTSPQTGTRAR